MSNNYKRSIDLFEQQLPHFLTRNPSVLSNTIHDSVHVFLKVFLQPHFVIVDFQHDCFHPDFAVHLARFSSHWDLRSPDTRRISSLLFAFVKNPSRTPDRSIVLRLDLVDPLERA